MVRQAAPTIAKPKPLQIGMSKTFFHELSKIMIDFAADDFKDVMKKTTGLDGDLIANYDPMEMAAKLNGKQLDLGIFHGHEFAWAKARYPDFLPLIQIAVNKQHDERAFLIVRQNSPARTLADLRGKKLDVPADVKHYCRIFLERSCIDKEQKESAAFFGSIQKSATQAAALDDVCRDNVQAALVDSVGLEFYKEIKGPVFAKNLKVLQQSDAFPPAGIVYKQGVLDEAMLNQLRSGLLKARTTACGRGLMTMWNIEDFEPISKDYAKQLTQVLKAYPAPR